MSATFAPSASSTPAASGSLKMVKIPLSEQAYEALKRQILDQELQPAQRLNIDALSRSCGISSSPIREALTKLVAEGLVVFTANAGFSVAPVPDPQRLRQLMEYRQIMEAHCASVGAALGDPAICAALAQAIADMEALSAGGSVDYQQYRAFIGLEQQFHATIVDSGRNPVIAEAWRNLHLILHVARLSVVPYSNRLGSQAAVQEHQAILQAYQDRDGPAAEAAVRHHFQQAMDRLVRQG